jgi:hypothetical protein
MPRKLLQINYRLNLSRQAFEEQFGPVAAEIATVPGLRWKVWVVNEAEGEGGGLYLFEDEASLHAYLEGPIVAVLKSHPAFEGLIVKSFDVLDSPTAVTRGPIR